MHQYVAHTLYVVPVHFRMTGTKFKSQHINSLSNYFYMFYQPVIYDRVG